MCKFSSKEDVGYQRITYALSDIFAGLPKAENTTVERAKTKTVETNQIEESQ
jgi:hypothetical protein